MKIRVIILAIAMLTLACGNNAKKDNDRPINTIKEKEKADLSPMEKIRAINKEKEALKTQKPVSVKTLEDWLPETVMGMQKIKGGALSQNGVVGVNANYLEAHPEYGKDYGKKLDILIIDGHGEKGAMAVLEFLSIQYEEYVTYGDTKVKEVFNTNNNTYTLSFFYKHRFGVEMTLKGVQKEELWTVFKAFKLDRLTK